MKKGLLVVAGMAVAATGTASFQQLQYEQYVQAAVQDLVEQVKDSEIEGVPIHALYDHHQGGLFESTGRVTLIAGRSTGESRIELDYVVQHYPDVPLSGASYRVEVRNSILDGSVQETLTSKLFNGKPVLMSGVVSSDSATGTVHIPEIWLTTQRDTVSGSAGTITWKAGITPEGAFSKQFSADLSYPGFEIKSQQGKKTGGLKIDGIQGEFAYDQRPSNNSSHLTAGFQSFDLVNRGNEFRLGKTAWRSDWEVGRFAKSRVNFSVLNALIKGNEIPKIALNISLDKLNAEAVQTIQQLVESADQERWGAENAQQELYGMMLQLSDQLIQDDPVLAVEDLQVELGEKGSFALDGSIMLDHSKLSPTAMRELMSSGRASAGFQNDLRHALNINLHAQAEGEAQKVIYAALRRKARPIADAMQDGDLVITAENGVLKIDGTAL
ncbi:DUF945 family protein [Motiliproteus coralliicola]|uniref:DUF945 family protein n=1 Tax=Motiliproteus coralliicola TaxID=2283196 RepID=A0A369WCY3_9GAMM|nr:DUF945 family protein [Motiliproteus coralliicola]RDE19890.1 DUF945 family protein [Motiliproteus coralliicola]